MSFEVKLVSNLYVEDRYKNGISLGQYTRRKSISVLSVADIQVNKTADHQGLTKIITHRNTENPNQYNVTVIVPERVNQRF